MLCLAQGIATNLLLGKSSNHGNQSGIGGLAASFLGGGQGSQSQSSTSHGSGGLVGQLAGSLLGGGDSKPYGQSGQSSGSGSSHQQSGLTGLAAGMLGGHHGSVRRLEEPLKSCQILIVLRPSSTVSNRIMDIPQVVIQVDKDIPARLPRLSTGHPQLLVPLKSTVPKVANTIRPEINQVNTATQVIKASVAHRNTGSRLSLLRVNTISTAKPKTRLLAFRLKGSHTKAHQVTGSSIPRASRSTPLHRLVHQTNSTVMVNRTLVALHPIILQATDMAQINRILSQARAHHLNSTVATAIILLSLQALIPVKVELLASTLPHSLVTQLIQEGKAKVVAQEECNIKGAEIWVPQAPLGGLMIRVGLMAVTSWLPTVIQGSFVSMAQGLISRTQRGQGLMIGFLFVLLMLLFLWMVLLAPSTNPG